MRLAMRASALGRVSMDKAKSKSRDIEFYSEKNKKRICVHSREAKQYAERLEMAPNVLSYSACVELDEKRYQYVNPIDIRQDYFKVKWTSDFMLHYHDGSIGIREVVLKDDLMKRACVEKLEFSRRYWACLSVKDWKVVIVERGNNYVF